MSYLQAKILLQQRQPKVSFKMFAIETVVLVGAAIIMVSIFT